jgi:hypothetical protein
VRGSNGNGILERYARFRGLSTRESGARGKGQVVFVGTCKRGLGTGGYPLRTCPLDGNGGNPPHEPFFDLPPQKWRTLYGSDSAPEMSSGRPMKVISRGLLTDDFIYIRYRTGTRARSDISPCTLYSHTLRLTRPVHDTY